MAFLKRRLRSLWTRIGDWLGDENPFPGGARDGHWGAEQSAERLAALLESAPVGISFSEDASCTRITGNRTLLDQFEIARTDNFSASAADPGATGRKIRYHQDGRLLAHMDLPLQRAVAENTLVSMEFEVELPSGRRWICEATAAPVRDSRGRVIGGTTVTLDATKRRHAEEKLRLVNESLEARVQEEIAAREEAQRRLAHVERMQALGELAGGIAHDFNNVLQAIEGGAALIERQPEDAEKVRRIARRMLDSTARGAAVTRRLLAFARRDELRGEVIDVPDFLDDLPALIAHAVGDLIRIECVLAPSRTKLFIDKAQLETTLVNVAANARDAMPNGGTLRISAAEEMVDGTASHSSGHLAGLPPGRYLRLSLADTGTGMNAATLAHVGEPFFTTKPRGRGTGLGIAMAKGFAEQSGGALFIESTPGTGTTVTLCLPLAEDQSAPPEHERRTTPDEDGPSSPRAAPARVLLVDDDSDVREILSLQIADAGYAVLEAQDAVAAIALLDAGEPVDMLVTDLSMPGISGLVLAREVRARRPHLPVVVVTGYVGDHPALADGGTSEGFILLRKPVSSRQLRLCLESILQSKCGGGPGCGLPPHDRPCQPMGRC